MAEEGKGLMNKLRASLGRGQSGANVKAGEGAKPMKENEREAKRAAKEAEGNKEGWVMIQRKTFTRWANQYLDKDKKIESITEDLADGLRLGALLEKISGDKKVGKLNKTPKLEVQMMENLNCCLDFIKKNKIELVNIGSGDIFRGNEKLILGLIWTLILRWEVAGEGKQGLLLWVQRVTKPYDRVKVTDFTSSWRDGMAFNALVHLCRNDLVDMKSLNPANGLKNCDNAFKLAEEHLGIAKLLDAEDVVNSPDEKSIMTYVAQFLKKLSAGSHLRAVQSAVEVTRRHDDWMDRYGAQSKEVREFISGNSARLAPGSAEDRAQTTTQAVADALDAFDTYMVKTKTGAAQQRSEAAGLYSTIVSSKRSNNRPEFDAAVTPEELEKEWSKLEQVEQAYERRTLDKYVTFQAADVAVGRFGAKASTLTGWLKDKRAQFQKGEVGKSSPEVEANLELHKTFEARFALYGKMLGGMRDQVATAAKAEGHAGAASIKKELAFIEGDAKEVDALGKGHRAKLEAALKAFKTMEEKDKAFVRQADELDFLMDDLDECAMEGDKGATAEELKTRAPDMDKARKAAQALAALAKEVAGVRPTAPEAAATANKRVEDLDKAIAKRGAELAKKADAEKAKEAVCKDFAAKANELANFCSKTQKDMGALRGSAEDQQTALGKLREQVAGDASQGRKALKAVEASHDACESAGVVANRFTPHTVHSLRAMYLALVEGMQTLGENLQRQIMAKLAQEVSPEQLADIQEVFAAFDSDKDGKLKLKEFAQACQGAGIDMTDQELEQAMRERTGNNVISLDEFTKFFLDSVKAGDTEDDVKRAFDQIGKEGKIDNSTIDQNFVQIDKDLAEYLKKNIKGGDYVGFTKQLFSR